MVEDAAAHRFRGVRRQNRPDLELLEHAGDPVGRDPEIGAACDRAGERRPAVTPTRHRARLPLQLGEVDQLKIGRERADQPGGVLERNRVELLDERSFAGRVVVLAQRAGLQPDGFLELVEGGPFVFPQRFAEQLAEQADFGPQPGVDQGRVGSGDAHRKGPGNPPVSSNRTR